MKLNINQVKTLKDFNPREKLEHGDVEALALSMKTRGQLDPIMVREGDNELINGKHRLAAAKSLRWKQIEVKTVKATDSEARILAVVTNNFGRRLSHLELGKNVYLILEEVKKRTGRETIKHRLASELGLSVPELESCLATYRNLDPEARDLSSYAVRKGVLHVERLREIRQLAAEKQLAVLRQVVKAPDAPAADRLVSAFIAAQNMTGPAASLSQETTIETETVRKVPEKEETLQPPINEIVQANHLRMFRDITYSAAGVCPKCHQDVTLLDVKVQFNPPLWQKDLAAILESDIAKLTRNHLTVPAS